MSQSLHQKPMIDMIKQTFDVKLHDPIVTPASLTRYRIALCADFLGRYPKEFSSKTAETVGTPKTLVPPDFSGIATALTDGGK